jgi:hypothetical protein
MRTVITKLFKFEELTEEAQKKAIENNYQINVDDTEWDDSVRDDAQTIGKIMGIDISRIYFSGFSSQGDGACFEGNYSYETGSVKKLKEYAPEDKTLHDIAERLQAIQKKHFYKLTANVKHSGHYYHEMCTDIEVYKDGNYILSDSEQEAEEELKDILRDYMRWIYRTLEKEYDYLTGEEAIKETIIANGLEFKENGKPANF